MDMARLTLIRNMMLGGVGLVCLLYAVLALMTGRPDPLPDWVTAVAGVIGWVVIWQAARAAGSQVANQTFDEGYRNETLKAQSFGFWVAIWLYPVFAVLLYSGQVDWPVVFASMGCLTAAAYLLGVVWLDMRGRG